MSGEAILEGDEAKGTLSINISIVIPFDIGESYIFKATSKEVERIAWRAIFESPHAKAVTNSKWSWDTAPLGKGPSYYREPYGPVARLLRKNPEGLLSGVSKEKRIFKEISSAEAIFFARGIGVLLATGSLREELYSGWRREFRARRESLKEELGSVVCEVRDTYCKIMSKAARDNPSERKIISWLDIPGTRRKIDKARFPHAIAFICSDKPESGIPEAAHVSLSSPTPLRYPHPDFELYVSPGWGESSVFTSSSLLEARRPIEDAFVAAMASWFSLVVMSTRVSEFLRDAFLGIGSKQQSANDKNEQLIRLAFLDTSNASRPVRWTFREADILLLDRIHETWSSERWWKSIEERTALLSAHHSEVAAAVRRKWDRKIAVIGVVLGATTTVSAIKDVADTVGASKEYVLVLMAIALVAAFALFFWARSVESE